MKIYLIPLIILTSLYSQNIYPDIERYIEYELKINHKINSNYEISYLQDLTAKHIRVIRNSFFAKKGYIFKTEWLSEFFKNQIWYKGKIENIDEIVLTTVEKNNIALLKKMEDKALPEWTEDKILQHFQNASYIEAALRIDNKNSTYWVLSLVPIPLNVRYTEKYHLIKKAQKVLTDDEIVELLDITMSLESYLEHQKEGYRGSFWIEVIKINNKNVQFLESGFFNRDDLFISGSLEGELSLSRFDSTKKIECKIDYTDNTNIDKYHLKKLWSDEENSNQFEFIKSRCCCACDCISELYICKIGDSDIVELISRKNIY